MARAVVLEDHDVEQGHDEVLGQVDHVEDHDDLEAQTLDEAHVEQEVQLDPVPVKDRLVGLMVQLRDRSTSRHLAVDAGVDLQKHSVASEAVTSKPRTWRSSRILEKSAVGFFTVVLSG